MYAMKWGNPRRVKYECKIKLLAKFTGIWCNEHSCKMGWVIMKSKCANVNEYGDNMIWG